MAQSWVTVNAAASDAIEQTRSPSLLYNPAASPPVAQQPLAQFRVVFTDNGVLQVSPGLVGRGDLTHVLPHNRAA